MCNTITCMQFLEEESLNWKNSDFKTHYTNVIFWGKIAQLKNTEHLKNKFQGQLIHNNSPDVLWLWHVGKSLIKSCKGLKETKQGLTYKMLHMWNCYNTIIADSMFHYLLGSTHAVTGQFEDRILLYDPLKFKAIFVAKLFRDLSPSVLNISSK